MKIRILVARLRQRQVSGKVSPSTHVSHFSLHLTASLPALFPALIQTELSEKTTVEGRYGLASCSILPQACPLPWPPQHTRIHTYSFIFILYSVAWPVCHSNRTWKLGRESVGKRQKGWGGGLWGNQKGNSRRCGRNTVACAHLSHTRTRVPGRSHSGFAPNS